MKKLLSLFGVGLFVALLFNGHATGAVFAKYDGVDGESTDANHDKWIDVLVVERADSRPNASKGKGRRRGNVIIGDLVLEMEYEKASVKLVEKLWMGEVIPKLEIELTANYGGSRATYLKYELKNVQIVDFAFQASGSDESPPTIVVGHKFEEIKITYTEYDDEGNKGGNAETTWKVEKGEK